MRIDYPYLHRVVCSLGRKIKLKRVETRTVDFENQTDVDEFDVLGHVQISNGASLNMDALDTEKEFVRVYFKYNVRANIPKIRRRDQVDWFVSWYGQWFRLIEIDQHQTYGFVMGRAELWEGVPDVV